MSNGPGFFGEEPEPAGTAPARPDGPAEDGSVGSHGGDPAGGTGGAGDEDDGTFADVLNSLTLDSGRARRKEKAREDSGQPTGQQPVQAPPAWPDTEPPAGLFESGPAVPGEPPMAAETMPPVEETGFVRPYALTGGRTKANHTLELETLISANDGGTVAGPELVEHRSIVEECHTPRSVAEIASTLRVPLGVARVLISDAADAGLVNVHKTVSGDEGVEEHLQLMERVLSGLRRL